MSEPADAVANEFLDLAERQGQALTHMKLQKLVYFAHGWHLALNDTPLFSDRIEAWRFGPVIPSLYGEFKEFGDRPIDRHAVELEWQPDGKFKACEPKLDEGFARQLIEKVWEIYGRYTGVQLSNMTHQPGTPWARIRDSFNGRIPPSVAIPDSSIKEHFCAMAAE